MHIASSEIIFGTFRFRRSEVQAFEYDPASKTLLVHLYGQARTVNLGEVVKPWPFNEPLPLRVGFLAFLPEHIQAIRNEPGKSFITVWTTRGEHQVLREPASNFAAMAVPPALQPSTADDWLNAFQGSV